MNWDPIVRLFGKVSAALIMFFFYLTGKKTARDHDDLEALKEANQKLTQEMIDGDKIKEKYEDLKIAIPDSWPDPVIVQSKASKVSRKNRSKRA